MAPPLGRVLTEIAGRVGFIGCGKLATALVEGLERQGFNLSNIIASVRTPESRQRVVQRFPRLQVFTEDKNSQLVTDTDVIALGVKPKDTQSCVRGLASCIRDRHDQNPHVLFSFAAGVPTGALTRWMGREVAIVRAMPNIAASQGLSITSLTHNQWVTPQQRELAEAFFSAIGKVVWVDERHMDVMTVVGASWPALQWHMAQVLIEVLKEQGVGADIAEMSVKKMMEGSAVVAANTEIPLEELIGKVTTKEGVTFVARTSLDKAGFAGVLGKAVHAGVTRCQELTASLTAHETRSEWKPNGVFPTEEQRPSGAMSSSTYSIRMWKPGATSVEDITTSSVADQLAAANRLLV